MSCCSRNVNQGPKKKPKKKGGEGKQQETNQSQLPQQAQQAQLARDLYAPICTPYCIKRFDKKAIQQRLSIIIVVIIIINSNPNTNQCSTVIIWPDYSVLRSM